MRFLASQDDSYGVGLVQDRLPDYADESMMAATGDTEQDGLPRVEEGSMISNLPLLFVEGYPTSLDKISLKQLERFIAFMVQCSLGHDTAQVISEPQWWPKEVKFTNPLIRPKKLNDSWMANLKKLVFRCYTYHRSEYLLRFCSYLAQYPRDKLYYIDNWDSTTSLYHKVTGKLLVTFRNENMNYDKVVESPRRSLLPQHGCSSSFPSRTKQLQLQNHQQQQEQSNSRVVIQSPSDEIYLCDNCDAEFVGLEKMQDHEKTCGRVQSTSASRPRTPTEIPLKSEIGETEFLQYFGLYSTENRECSLRANDATLLPDNSSIAGENRGSRRVRSSVNLTRCPAIPFSSPAGLAMAKKSKMMTEGTQQERLDRIERHMQAPALGKSARPKWLDRFVEYNRWVVTYKPNRERTIADESRQHTHEYKFQSRRNKLVLSIRSQLLFVACKPIYVSMERLSQQRITELKRDPSKYSCPVGRIATRVRQRPRPKLLPKYRKDARASSLLKRKTIVEKNENEKARILDATTATTTIDRGGAIFRDNREFDDLAEITIVEKITSPTREESLLDDKTSGIMIVDLCSSSDDESETVALTSDENRDPMILSRDNNERLASGRFVKNSTTNKYNRAKARVHPADSTSDWPRDNVLTDENDKSVNKCHPGAIVLENCAKFSPIFKPTP